ncbi:MAG: Ig-like domain-containing protein [Gemmatimonadaceae bacterium]
MHVRRQMLVWVAASTMTLACGGGGDGGTAGPAAVATVQLTASASTLEVGSSLSTIVRLSDAQGRSVTGRSVTYQSSAANIATVDNNGTVTGVGPGSVSITATSEGKSGTLALTVTVPPIGFVAIDQRTPSVRLGESTTLTVKAFDNAGREVTGRTIAWSSAAATVATVTSAGVVTGVSTGSVYIRAETDGKRDSVPLRVRSLITPSIASTAPATWTPGATATIDGANFSTNAASNEVYIGTARATVTAATASRLTIVVPSAAQLPCTPTGPTAIFVVVNGDSALGTAGLQMATPRTLAAGQALLLTTQSDLLCNEFSVTGGTYLITAFNYGESANTRNNFSLLGAATTGTAAQVVTARAALSVPLAQGFPMPLPPALERRMRHQRVHLDMLEAERSFMATRRNPVALRRQRARVNAQGARLSVATAPVPNVGDMLTLRMRRVLDDVLTWDNVRGRVVYVGPKMVIVEDSAAPLARTMDAEYEKIGKEFDTQMYGFLSSFGDPLAVDSLTDANGRLFAVFSKRVNTYRNGEILGFVTLCDFFDNTGPPDEICPSSNVGEYFYAAVPDPNAANGFTIEQWRRFMRGTLIHEAKHVAAYAEKLLRATTVLVLEESWLEEATAQQAAELWARSVYGIPWKGDGAWSAGPRCDYAPVGGSCADPVEGILGHFVWLYQYYDQQERKSMLSSASVDGSIYGSAWSFARWVTDTYAADEAAFLRSLTQTATERGVANIANKTGRPFSELLGYWSLASLADNYPGVTFTDSRLQLASWNSRDLFSAMSQFLRFADGRIAFPKSFPLTIRAVTFGNWSATSQVVNGLAGGSFAAWELAGAQTRPQVLGVRAIGGGQPPANIGLAIVRVQ